MPDTVLLFKLFADEVEHLGILVRTDGKGRCEIVKAVFLGERRCPFKAQSEAFFTPCSAFAFALQTL